MFVKIYPSSLIITPEPFAVAVPGFLLKIELTEYSTVIATIEGWTFFATPTAVSEYPWSEINWVFKLAVLELSSSSSEVLIVTSCLTIFSFKNGILTQAPKTTAVPSTPQKNGNTTVLPKPAPTDFCFFSLFLNSL